MEEFFGKFKSILAYRTVKENGLSTHEPETASRENVVQYFTQNTEVAVGLESSWPWEITGREVLLSKNSAGRVSCTSKTSRVCFYPSQNHLVRFQGPKEIFSRSKIKKTSYISRERSTLCCRWHRLNRWPGSRKGKEPDAWHFKSHSLIVPSIVIAQLFCKFKFKHNFAGIWHQKRYRIVLSVVLFTENRSTSSSQRRRKYH